MNEEKGTEAAVTTSGKHLKDMGMLDLRHVKSAEELKGIAEISDIGVILISEDLVGALSNVNIHDVGGIMPVPAGGKVNCMTGQTRLTGEALASGDPETSLVLVGQTFITTPVSSVGYKEIRTCGQLFATRGSESALSPKIAQQTGQNFYLPSDPRFIMGEEKIGTEYLELLPKPTSFVIMGEVTFSSDVTRDLLLSKVDEIVLMGEIHCPQHLQAALQIRTKEKMGEIKSYDA